MADFGSLFRRVIVTSLTFFLSFLEYSELVTIFLQLFGWNQSESRKFGVGYNQPLLFQKQMLHIFWKHPVCFNIAILKCFDSFLLVWGCDLCVVFLVFYAFSIGVFLAPGDFPSYVEYIRCLEISPAILFPLKTVVAFPLVYHYINGIRHLVSKYCLFR